MAKRARRRPRTLWRRTRRLASARRHETRASCGTRSARACASTWRRDRTSGTPPASTPSCAGTHPSSRRANSSSSTADHRRRDEIETDAAAAKEHHTGVASLLRTLGEARLPPSPSSTATPPGALGIGVSAHYVDERTWASLPGPAHGCVPAAFASYQLARLPTPGLGLYLALTGAALSGQEMVEVGLATHLCESQAVRRVAAELQHQRVRANGRTLRNVDIGCIERAARPAAGPRLFYARGVLGGARRGRVWAGWARSRCGTPRRQALLDSSPLALSLTFELRHGGDDGVCWTDGRRRGSRVHGVGGRGGGGGGEAAPCRRGVHGR